MAFKVASQKKQYSLRRFLPKFLGDFDDEPTPAEARENILLAIKKIQEELKDLPPKDERRIELGRRHQELQRSLTDINRELKRYDARNRPDADLICDVVRKLYPKEWSKFVQMAVDLRVKIENMSDEEIDKKIAAGKRVSEFDE